MATGTDVAAGELITHTKMNLKQEDYELLDDENLVLGTGDDCKIDFDGTNIVITIASQFNFKCSGGDFCLDTVTDTDNVRLNSRDYEATSGDVTAVQTKPNISVGGTTGVTGIEASPRFADGKTGSKLVGIMSNPILKGTTGNLSSAMRCYEGKLESDSGSTRTLAEAYVLHCMQALHGTVTVGPYCINVDAGGGNVAWAGFAKLPDDGQVANDGEDKSGGTLGWIKVMIGSKTGYIQVEQLA